MELNTKEFLNAIIETCKYWGNLKDKQIEQCTQFMKMSKEEYICRGTAFSILAIIDGCSSLNNFKQYDIKDGEKLLNNNIELHDLFSKLYDK